MGLRVVGLDFQGLLVMGDGLVDLSAAGQHEPEVVVGFGVVGLDFQGLAVMGDGLVDLLLGRPGRCQGRCAVTHPRAALDRDAKVLDGHVGPAPLHRQHAEVVMQSPVVRRLGERRLVGLPSRLQGLRRRCQSAKLVPSPTRCGLAEAVVELIGERSSGRHLHHRGGQLVLVPRSQRQQFRAALPRRDCALLARAASCGKAAQTWSKTARASK